MKRLLNTLFVTTQGTYLSKQGDTVVVSHEQETKLRVPIHNLGSIVCFGNVGCSPFLMGFCGEQNVTLSFLTENGRFLARVHGPVNGNVLLRKEQYRRSDDAGASALIARSLVTAKLANGRIVLQRAQRDRQDLQHSPAIGRALDGLWELIQAVKDENDLDESGALREPGPTPTLLSSICSSRPTRNSSSSRSVREDRRWIT